MLPFVRSLFIVLVMATIGYDSRAEYDTLYIRKFYDKLIVKPYLGGPVYQLNFIPKVSADTVDSEYISNTYGMIGIDLTYKNFSIGLSKRVGEVEDEKKYGKSKYSSLAARLAFRRLIFEAAYRKSKGYADLNTPSYYKLLPDSTPYFIRNDIQNKYFKLKAIYQFKSNKYSAAAPYAFNERQLKSAMAPYILAYFNSSRVRGDSALIPFQTRSFYRKMQTAGDIIVNGIGIAPGLGFTVVLKKLFFSATVFAGAEIQHQKYYLEDSGKWQSKINIAPAADSRVSLGFSGDKAFVALIARNDIYNINFPNFKIRSLYSLVTIDFGYRFDAPGIVAKSYDKVDDILRKVKEKIAG